MAFGPVWSTEGLTMASEQALPPPATVHKLRRLPGPTVDIAPDGWPIFTSFACVVGAASWWDCRDALLPRTLRTSVSVAGRLRQTAHSKPPRAVSCKHIFVCMYCNEHADGCFAAPSTSSQLAGCSMTKARAGPPRQWINTLSKRYLRRCNS